MSWYPAARRELNDVLGFLRVREWSCVAFSSRLLSHEGGGNRIFVNRSPDERITESLLLTSHGLILPAIAPADNPPDRYHSELLPLISTYARGIHSVMGLDTEVSAIESLLPVPVYERIDYYLMTREYFNVERAVMRRGSLRVRRATPSDVRALFPLQRDYEKEEVLLNPEKFNPTASFLSLQKNLRQEMVFLAEIDGRPVAKAGTNARGMNYYQIGGVYTIPALRSRGIARALMQVLMWEIAREKKHLSLFVKKSNPAAIKLYTNLGFTIRDGFAISYYRP